MEGLGGLAFSEYNVERIAMASLFLPDRVQGIM